MKKSVKYSFLNILFAIYEPVISRIEKFRATLMWRNGVKQCIAMYKEIGAPRVYLFYDTKHMLWAPMTYEPNKLMKPSLRIFRRMGKARGVSKIQNIEDMKHYSFYYTPSKWGALGCDTDNQLRAEKLAKWVAYYMTHLSPAMRKCQEYRREAKGCQRRRCQ